MDLSENGYLPKWLFNWKMMMNIDQMIQHFHLLGCIFFEMIHWQYATGSPPDQRWYTHYVGIPNGPPCILCIDLVSWHGRMCVITEAKKLGVFADIMDKVQNRRAAWHFLKWVQYVISYGQTTIPWRYVSWLTLWCWPLWFIHSELKRNWNREIIWN